MNDPLAPPLETFAPGARTGLSAHAAQLLQLYLTLTKARLSALVVITAGLGYVVGAGDGARLDLLLATVTGVCLLALGANGLNQWIEADRDALMKRTAGRPLPAGRLTPRHAAVLCSTLSVAGAALLFLAVNVLTAALGVAAALIYLCAYTPLKTRSAFNTMVGAVSGAIPPLMGWTAATGEVGTGGLVLFAILFVWQIPHFLALAWLYREDYARGGFRMLPVIDRRGVLTSLTAVLYSVALVPLAAIASFLGLAGNAFAVGGMLLGGGMVVLALHMALRRTQASARRLFLASIIYLPILLALLALDQAPPGSGPANPIRKITATALTIPAP